MTTTAFYICSGAAPVSQCRDTRCQFEVMYSHMRQVISTPLNVVAGEKQFSQNIKIPLWYVCHLCVVRLPSTAPCMHHTRTQYIFTEGRRKVRSNCGCCCHLPFFTACFNPHHAARAEWNLLKFANAFVYFCAGAWWLIWSQNRAHDIHQWN